MFRVAYTEDVSSKFLYAQGNGGIYKIASNELSNKNNIVVVYLDTIPGNIETRRVYIRLRNLSKNNDFRLVVLPILGAEYYMIKSIKDKNVVEIPYEVNNCINKNDYFNSIIIENDKDKAYCINYERYCKLILLKAVKDCIKIQGIMIQIKDLDIIIITIAYVISITTIVMKKSY